MAFFLGTAFAQYFHKSILTLKLFARSADFNIALMETLHECSLKGKRHKKNKTYFPDFNIPAIAKCACAVLILECLYDG